MGPVPLDYGNIEITGRRRAAKIKRRFGAVITIENQDQRRGDQVRFWRVPAPDQAVLVFDDIEESLPKVIGPSAQVVERALFFARDHRDTALLIHCNAGVARSPAIALAVIFDRLGPGQEEVSLRAMLTLCPEAVPNLLIVKFADEVLGCQGRLLDKVVAWDRPRAANLRRRELNRLAHLRSYGLATPADEVRLRELLLRGPVDEGIPL